MALLDRFVPKLYLRLAPDSVEVRSSQSDMVWREEALVAIGPNPKKPVLAMGTAARQAAANTPGAHVHAPFSHPRCLISDYLTAEHFIQYAVRSTIKHAWLSPAPVLYIHPVPSAAQAVGGLTQIEHRALSDLGQRTGARSTHLVRLGSLTESQIQALLRGQTDAPA